MSPNLIRPNERFAFCAIGELNVDLRLHGPPNPIIKQTEELVDDAELTAGGYIVVFAHQAAEQGPSVAYVGKVGKGPADQYVSAE